MSNVLETTPYIVKIITSNFPRLSYEAARAFCLAWGLDRRVGVNCDSVAELTDNISELSLFDEEVLTTGAIALLIKSRPPRQRSALTLVYGDSDLLSLQFLSRVLETGKRVCRLTCDYAKDDKAVESILGYFLARKYSVEDINTLVGSDATLWNGTTPAEALPSDSSDKAARLVRKKLIQKIKEKPFPMATGFLVGRNYLMTNHHVIDGSEALSKFYAQFLYDSSESQSVNYELAEIVHTNKVLDYTIIKLKALEQVKRQSINQQRQDLGEGVLNHLEAGDNFSDLNLGKMDKFSLPKRIFVGVSNKLIDFNKYPRFKSIIDTRGMDDTRDRKDLSDYIRSQDNSICLFAEQFIAAPSNISELLKRYLTRESRDIDTKVALLVLPRKGEPENVVNLDGRVEDKYEGIEVRKNQIDDVFARENIKFLSENIFFYDALQFYDEEHILKLNYEKNDVFDARTEVLDAINDLISRREKALLKEAKDYKQIFHIIKNGRGLSPQEEKMINDLKKTIESHGNTEFLSDFESRYKNHLKSYHVMVFRAINNRFGTYGLRDIDIYFDGSTVTEVLLRDRLLESKAEIVGAIEFVEEHASEKSGLKPVMQILREQIDEYFEKTVIEIGQETCDCIRNSLAPQTYSNQFWDYAQNRWGQGPGYRENVLGQYGSQISGLDDWLVERVQEVWKQNFMDRILEFFGES